MLDMEQFEIDRKENRFIYLIKDANIQFYLVIPKNNRVSMILYISDNVNNDNIKNIADFQDKVIVVPILNQNVIQYLKNFSTSYQQTDQYFSNLINAAYNILSHNNIIIDSKVYLNNNVLFGSFNNYFINRFNGRVEIINLNLSKLDSNVNDNPNLDVLDDINNGGIVKEDTNIVANTIKEPGFVSYVLLGVLVAVLSLVFLYFIL